jgi:hypothetical protein
MFHNNIANSNDHKCFQTLTLGVHFSLIIMMNVLPYVQSVEWFFPQNASMVKQEVAQKQSKYLIKPWLQSRNPKIS